MKKIVFTLVISGVILGGVGGGCGWKTGEMAKGILVNDPIRFADGYKYFRWCAGGVPGVARLPELLDGKTYVILLQNNNELRASGGFMGSYAKLKFVKGGLAELAVQDIYVPDGQLVGHVDPPIPIQQAFGQGWWKLRDSNWDIDFRVAGEQIAWFFEQGGEKVDGMAAVNLSWVNKWLEVLGEVKTEGYGERVTARNLAGLAQKYAEVGFFPGSTQKRDFLGAVGGAVLKRTKEMKISEGMKLAKLVYNELGKKQIVLWFRDKETAEIIREKEWDGGWGDYGAGDYLYVVEANLGANKANCCVSREVTQEVTGEREKVRIRWDNRNEFTNPRPPVFWGGDYVDFVRVVVPAGAAVRGVMVGSKELSEREKWTWQYGIEEEVYVVEEKERFKIVGFWAKVPAGQSTTAEIIYDLPATGQILVRRQPGMESFGYKLAVDGKVVVSDTIDRDKGYTWTK